MQFSRILTSFALAGTWAVLLLGQPAASASARPDSASAADLVLLDMNQAYKRAERKRLTALLPQARGHALEPWAAYWELALRLDDAPRAEIEQFLARYAGSYQEDRLRNDWLLLLGKRGDWATFNAEYPKYRMGDDRSLRCYALQAHYSATGSPIAETVQALWLSLKDQDDGCASAADQQLKAGKLSAHGVWVRARLGLENDRVRVATQAVSLLNPQWTDSVARLYASPARYLNDKVLALRPRTKELVTLALVRLATIDPGAAADELGKLRWRTQLTAEERSWVWGVLAKRAAQRQNPQAGAWFANTQNASLHDDHLAWKTRLSLKAQNWSEVRLAVDAMSDAQRNDPTWVYWRARALRKLAQTDAQRAEATQALQSIAGVKGFYEQLALEELGQRIQTPARPVPLTAAEQDGARQNAGLQRALLAIQIGLRSDGVREWNYSIGLHTPGGMGERELLAAADLACQREVWDRCINTSERTKTLIDFEQRFPMPFREAVIQRTAQIGLDPAYVYGLIRQESRFITDARSGVGAAGLMQVMPPTARWTAKKIGLVNFQPNQITERDTNIAIGTGYLKLVLDGFDGSLALAAAAYNAGPSRPRSWRPQSGEPSLEAAIWAENVPFSETRDYVKKVLANTTSYAALISGQPQSLKARLGTIGAKDGTGPDPTIELP